MLKDPWQSLLNIFIFRADRTHSVVIITKLHLNFFFLWCRMFFEPDLGGKKTF